TTLLRTMIGEIAPISGQVYPGHNVRIGYYSQTHSGLNPDRTIVDEIRQTSALSEDAARSFLARFLFTGDDVFKPITALSGGNRRWSVSPLYGKLFRVSNTQATNCA